MGTRHGRRTAAAVLGLSLCGGLLATAPAGAAVDTTTFCASVTPGTSGFGDIGGVSPTSRADIECLAASGITSGTGPGTYSPSGVVFRDSMATFVSRLVDTANDLEATDLAGLPADAPDGFGDDDGNVHEANIDRLAAAGIVNGKGPGRYGPGGPGNEVTRAQMATFLVAAIDHLRGTDLPAAPDAFGDDQGDVHEPNIDKLAAIDVVDGVGGGAYGPGATLSRSQMAAFLVRTLAYLEAEGDISPLPGGTRTIVLSPPGTVVNDIDSAPDGAVAFTASQITAADVDIALFPCENLSVAGGRIVFADTAPDDGVADPGGELVDAAIVEVNGSAADAEHVSGVAVTNGSVTFEVDSERTDCVHAVVWDDADDDDALDLDGGGVPTEQHGTSGQIGFVPPAAASGPMDEDVAANDEDANTFVGCELGAAPGAGTVLPEQGLNAVSATDCATFSYDSGDGFFIDANANLTGDDGEAVSLAVFEAALSPGDDVSGTYDAAAAGRSVFVLTDEAPVAPGGVAASPLDGDTVRVTWTAVPGADAYRVYARPEPGIAPCAAFTTTGANPHTVRGTAAADATALDVDGLSESTRYCFVVTAVDQGDESGPSAADDATTSADTSAPVALDTELTTNASQPRADGGDVIQICFDQDIADPQADELAPLLGDDETVQLRDADGTVVRLTQGDNAVFRRGTAPATSAVVVGAAGSPTCALSRVLEIVIDAEVEVVAPGSTANLQFPADIVAAGDIEDLAGTQFQPDGDPDVRVDVEAGPEPD